MTYLLNLIFIPLYYVLIQGVLKRKPKINFIFVLAFGIHAILFRSLANPFNYTDTEGYALAYTNISSMTLGEALTSIYASWGPAYVFINWLLSRICTDPIFLFTFLSVSTISCVVWFYYKSSYSILISSLIYCMYPMLYLMSFGVVRQHFSLVFILLSLYFITDKKKSIFFAIISILIHTSSIVFIPFYFWKLLKVEKRNPFILISILSVGFLIMRISMNFLLSFLERYSDEGFGTEGNNNTLPIFLLGSLSFLIYISKTIRKAKESDKNIISFIFYGFLVSLFSFGLHGAGRLTLMFIYVFPVGITFLKKYTNHVLFRCYTFAIFCLIVFILIITYHPETYDYLYLWEKIKVYK